jgi:RNA polymerase sigma-54 factor
MEALLNTAARPLSLQEFLFQQFNLLDISESERDMGKNIIFNLDKNGYLRDSLGEIFDFENGNASRVQAEQVLSRIQGLEPKGVGGRDLVEVLLLQLDPDDPSLPAKEKLIRNHLVDLQKNRLPRIAKSMGIPIEGLKRLVVEVSLLHPRPGVLHNEESPMRILPDVIVDRIDGEYIVRLEDQYLPSLRISGLYRKLLRDKSEDREARDYIRKKIESARWIIEAITQRQNTLYRVACEIFRIQRPFLDHGITRMRPLKMQAVADSLEIHVSTVSRAISGKFVQTHRGIYPLKYFFSGGTVNASGKNLSRSTVKMRVREIIGNENPSNPLSDEEVGRIFRREGLNVARRTVTKYRKVLNIPCSRRRKEF